MKYVALDIETTGLTVRHPSRVLQISLVVEDTANQLPVEQLPHLTFFINQEEIVGEPFALQMNAWILNELASYRDSQFKVRKNVTKYAVLEPKEVESSIRTFLDHHFGTMYRPTVAGKNVAGFDLSFFPDYMRDWFSHKCLDVGTLFFDEAKDKLPSNTELAKMFDLPEVSHDALGDNHLTILLIRKWIELKNQKSQDLPQG